MSKIKLNKVEVKVSKVETVKVDKRKNNPGRPINKKSARYIRLQKQAFYASVNDKFKKGNQFIINNVAYKYVSTDGDLGCIVSVLGNHECNVSYIGRTKVQGFTFVLGKKVKVELNLKTLKFTK
jgi:hypothetical protein